MWPVGVDRLLLLLLAFTAAIVSLLLLLQIYIVCFLSRTSPREPVQTPGPAEDAATASDAAATDDTGVDTAAAAACLPAWLGGEPGDCVVCLSTLEGDGDGDSGAGAGVRVLPKCRHAFHAGCIGRWLVSHSVCCPICRTPTRSEAATSAAAVITSPPLPAAAPRTDEEVGIEGGPWAAHGAVLLEDHQLRHELHLPLLLFY